MISKHKYITHLLKIEPNNPRYIKRYVDYLELCEEHNEQLEEYPYMEAHHILPKADDMFPEFKDFDVQHTWNKIFLNCKQHIIAHILLKKAFPQTQSAVAAVHYYLNVQNNETIAKNQRDIPDTIKAIYAAKAKEDFYESRRGYAPMKCPVTGAIHFLHRDDPTIKELGLVSIQQGTKHSEESKEKMAFRKLIARKITLYFLDREIKVRLFSDEYDDYISQGWTTESTEVDKEYIKILRYEKSSESLKDRADYMYPDGRYFGKITNDDPAIEKYGLIYHMTQARKDSAAQLNAHAVVANTGTQWYNNGIINKKFKSDPGHPWVLGQINISDTSKEARANGIRAVRQNKVCYNDGKNNFYYYPDEVVSSHMKKGMASQKKRTMSSKTQDYEIWNDGKQNYRVYPDQIPDPTWQKGMLKQQKKRQHCFTNGVDFILKDSQEAIPGWTRCKRPKDL